MHIAFAVILAASLVAVDDEPVTVGGVARYAGTDRPAAGVTLHFFDRDDPKTAVVTDEGGRFRCPASGKTTIIPRDGAPGPTCRVEAEGAGRWSWEPLDLFPFVQLPEMLRKQVFQVLARPAAATWRGSGAGATLRVECPPTGEVEVLVRGPDGGTLRDRPVMVVPAWQSTEVRGQGSARFTGRLDSDGRFRMRWFEGMRRLAVTVPGEGFGSTSTFEVVGGKTLRVETPPLARFGSIAGRLDPSLAGPGVEVGLDMQASPRATCDEGGRFELRDVVPGHHPLSVTRDGRRVAFDQVTVWVAPGRRSEGVAIVPPPPIPPGMTGGMGRPPVARNRTGPDGEPLEVALVAGTVRDAAGLGVAGAVVFVRVTYDGGMRLYEDVRKTTADDRGRYEVRGPAYSFLGPFTVIAKVKGRPPAVSAAFSRKEADGRPTTLDLTLADRGGSAAVAVLKDGKPMAGASVNLAVEGGSFRSSGMGFSGATRGPESAELDAIVSPSAPTGPDGIAHFDDLFPGLYAINAIDSPDPGAARAMAWSRRSGANVGRMRGLGVSAGLEAKASLALNPDLRKVPFLVLRPDGRPVADQNVSLQFGLGGDLRSSGMLKLDARGIGEHPFDAQGLWSVVIRFRDEEVNTFPVREEPFYEAEVLLPVSPGLRLEEPLRMAGVRRERGSLRVRLLDVDGRPARGMVSTVESAGLPDHAASTDERGEVRFEGMPGRPYQVRGSLEGPTPPPLASTGPFPEEAAFRGRFGVVPAGDVVVESGREAVLELRAKGIGFLLGTLAPPAGLRPADYTVFPDFDPRFLVPQSRSDPETARYFCGPLAAGPTTLRFRRRMEDGTFREAGEQVVEVVAGGVTHAELRPGEANLADRQVTPGMGGFGVPAVGPESAPVSAVLPDGATPAFAARGLLFVPGHARPISTGFADATGLLAWRGMWIMGDSASRGRDGLVARPTYVVSLPGRHGSTILPIEPGRPIRAVLPAPIAAEGRVTLGGRPPGSRDARVLVVASYQGRGVLDASLGAETTAGPDGRFSLPGLTPGRYAIQAARDGIWLSRTVELVAEAGHAPPPLALDIPEPGQPVTLEVVDEGGRPIAEQSIALIRPKGPLAPLWPATLRTDAAGRLALRGLETGFHAVSLVGASEKGTFEVREMAEGLAPPYLKRVILRRPGF